MTYQLRTLLDLSKKMSFNYPQYSETHANLVDGVYELAFSFKGRVVDVKIYDNCAICVGPMPYDGVNTAMRSIDLALKD